MTRASPRFRTAKQPAPAGVLDGALGIVGTRQGKRPSTVIRPLSQNLRQTLYARLAGSGVLRAEEGRILGIFPSHSWLSQDARHERELRRLVTQALVQQTTPDMRTVVLIAVLHALGCEHKIVDPRQYELTRRQLKARAQQIARGTVHQRPFARRSTTRWPRSRPRPQTLRARSRNSATRCNDDAAPSQSLLRSGTFPFAAEAEVRPVGLART
jgi:hypothetical protein